MLLHGFMDSHLILDVHLVKFINAADAIVCQHQSTCLNAELVVVRILHQPAQSIRHRGMHNLWLCQLLADDVRLYMDAATDAADDTRLYMDKSSAAEQNINTYERK